MSLKGWGIALLLSPVTLGFSIYIYGVIWFWSKVGKFYIKAMSFSIKALVGIIAWPFKKLAQLFGGSVRFVELLYYQGVHNVKRHNNTKYAGRVPKKSEEDEEEDSESLGFTGALKKIFSVFTFVKEYKFRYIALFIGIVWFFNYPSLLMSLIVNPAELMTVSGMLDFLPSLLIIALPFVITIFTSALFFEFFGDGTRFWKASDQAVKGAKHLGEAGVAAAGAAAGGAAAAGQTAKNAAEAGMEAKELGETAVTTASHIQTAGDMVGGEAAAEGAAEAGLEGLVADSAVAGALGEALPVIVVLAVAWIVYTLIAGIISLVLVIATWGFFIQLLPMVAGPVMAAAGLGEAYGQWFGQSTANTIGPQIGTAFEEEIRMVRQMGAKMGCALEGPQCLRQWRMNNTVRPGSESVGETYELRIDRFQLAQEQVDVAYKEKNYPLPVSFLVFNTRHGLKGITARDVRYRVTVEDSSHQGKNAYCSTGWTSINTSTGDFILPGLGVSPRETLQQINLADCGLLQPSMGVNRVLSMDLKYDYSSQATLYFDAMSRKHRREQGITPDFTKSETAKTPVQSYINVRSPVTYFETEGGDRRAIPFAARFGFETPGFSVDYRVDPDSIEIQDSVLTQHTSNCKGLGDLDGDDDYDISNRAEERIEDRQNDNWFSKNVNPAPLRCTFELTDPAVETINPTGEELIMRVDANYTIVREQQHSSFSMVNTLCARNNCPLLVTERYNDTHEGLMFSECTYGTSVDSYGGCAVLKPDKPAGFRSDSTGVGTQSGDIDWTDREILDDVEIIQGQTAIDWSHKKSELISEGAKSKHFIEDPPEGITGIKQDVLDQMDGDIAKAVYSNGRGRKRVRNLDLIFCNENKPGEDFEDFAQAYKSKYNWEKILYFSADTADCKSKGGWIQAIARFFTGTPSYSKFENRCDNRANSGQTAVVVSDGSSLRCYLST